MRRRYRRNRSLGLSPEDHEQRARDWSRSAKAIVKTAANRAVRKPCEAIGHFTDAIGELEVAATQAQQASDHKLARALYDLRDQAFQKQKKAIAACIRQTKKKC